MTSFPDLLPEQQIIMRFPSACWSFVSTLSRWSGVPDRTRTSQAPHMPSVQE